MAKHTCTNFTKDLVPTDYRIDILELYIRLFRGFVGHQLIFGDHNSRPDRGEIFEKYIKAEDIQRMNWAARSPDLNSIARLGYS